MAVTTADNNLLTPAQQTQIANYTKQWEAASKAGDTAGMAAAHAAAEAVRNSAGYTSDDTGAFSGYIRSGASGAPSVSNVSSGQAAPTVSPVYEYQTLYSAQNALYQQQLAAQKAAQEAAVQKAVSSLESQKTSTDQQYADLFRQLYVNKMKNRKNMGQQLAASGITGGAAESTLLGYDTAYEDALRQGEQGRISAINSLDQAITGARLTGDITGAEAAATAAKEQTSAYADTLRFLINRQDAIDAREESYAREDAQRAAAYAQQLLKEQREAEEKAKEEAEKASKPTLTVAQVNAAIKAGVLTDAVLKAYEYYYGEPYRG